MESLGPCKCDNKFCQVGTESVPCTPEVQPTGKSTSDGRQVALIGTPGFNDTTQSDTVILKKVATFLATT
jgi:hypothetical protein